MNRFSSLSGSNLRLEVSSYRFLKDLSLFCLSRRSSKSSPLGVCDSVLGVSEGLISFPVFGGFQGFSSSFSPIVFIPNVVLGILKVLQEDVPLFGILLITISLDGPGVVADGHILALTNLRIPSGSFRSSFFGIIVYTKINSATSLEEDALSNLLVF